MRHLVGNKHFLQIKYHGKAPNLIGYYDRGAGYEGNKANETTIYVKTLFDVETIRNNLGNDNEITNTPDVEITDDDGYVGGGNVGTANNFTDDELEDDVVTGEAYAFKFWSRSGPSSLGHSALTVPSELITRMA